MVYHTAKMAKVFVSIEDKHKFMKSPQRSGSNDQPQRLPKSDQPTDPIEHRYRFTNITK